MSLGLLKGRSQPGSVVAQSGSVLQSVPIISAPSCRESKKTMVVKIGSAICGHATRPDRSDLDDNGKPIHKMYGTWDAPAGARVRFPLAEAKNMIEKGYASEVADHN